MIKEGRGREGEGGGRVVFLGRMMKGGGVLCFCFGKDEDFASQDLAVL